MHRSVAATASVLLLLTAVTSFHPGLFAGAGIVGLVFGGIAIAGRPKPRSGIWVEVAGLAAATVTVVAVVAAVAYAMH